ncbi:MAG: TetR family transcriptional regulator C-terminal domain-containing protein, partial [Pigmentiphaga sp.]
MEVFTEKGYHATGIDEILKRVKVPKGSFYHFFESKEQFSKAVIAAYGEFFLNKLARSLEDSSQTPLARLQAFCESAKAGMAKYEYRRGCLIGNLGQEIAGISDHVREQLEGVLAAWQERVAVCLDAGVEAAELPTDTDTAGLARFFWIGWEGAVLRAKLTRNPDPLDEFWHYFRIAATKAHTAPAMRRNRSPGSPSFFSEMSMFKAIWLEKQQDAFKASLRQLNSSDELGDGDTIVRVEWSSLNYKDALAITGRGAVIRHFPIVPGIDLAGVVESSQSPVWQAGDQVLITGRGYGEVRSGGLSQLAKVSSADLVRLPAGATTRD